MKTRSRTAFIERYAKLYRWALKGKEFPEKETVLKYNKPGFYFEERFFNGKRLSWTIDECEQFD